jgi:UDP-N-acetylglucosamine--N-acetylmuramyl-(pentapeptide) pyrophosphoryl-undecaprenol N-acetylglucosamine transferase
MLGRLRGIVALAAGILEARRLLRKLRPAAVVGFGGYPSVPTVYAAFAERVPVLLHEQNAVLGRANRLLSKRARRIAVSFPTVARLRPADRSKVVVTGNPVRPGIAALHETAYPATGPDGAINLLILGGSQGARIFSEVVPAALGLLPEHLRDRLRLSQQCRAEDIDAARAAFAAVGAKVELASFFVDAPERMAACHLALCRAGASTIAELTTIGRPAVLVPYPHATDDHQTANAEATALTGGAWFMPQTAFTPAALAARLEAVLTLPESLAKAAEASRAHGSAQAARQLADAVLGLVRGNGAGGLGGPASSRKPMAEAAE